MTGRTSVLLAVGVAIVIGGLVLMLRETVPAYESPGGKPIAEQSCREIARTVSEIENNLTKFELYRGGIVRRIDELGGCPNIDTFLLDY